MKLLGLFMEISPILDGCGIPFILTAVSMYIVILGKATKNNALYKLLSLCYNQTTERAT